MDTLRKGLAGGAAILGLALLKKYICAGIDRHNVMQVEKYKTCFDLMERWVTVQEMGKTLESILEERGIGKVAVYGFGRIGRHVVTQLDGSRIEVVCAIDKAVQGYWHDMKIISLQESIPDADAVILTVISDTAAIEETLKKHTKCKIISLEELLYEG